MKTYKKVTIKTKLYKGKPYLYEVNYGGRGIMVGYTKKEAEEKAENYRKYLKGYDENKSYRVKRKWEK